MKTKDIYKSPSMEIENLLVYQNMLADSLIDASIDDALETDWGEI